MIWLELSDIEYGIVMAVSYFVVAVMLYFACKKQKG